MVSLFISAKALLINFLETGYLLCKLIQVCDTAIRVLYCFEFGINKYAWAQPRFGNPSPPRCPGESSRISTDSLHADIEVVSSRDAVAV